MIVRVLEATSSIPKGFSFQAALLSPGSVIEQEYNGSIYRFSIDKIQHVENNQYKISNSNVVVLVEVFEG